VPRAGQRLRVRRAEAAPAGSRHNRERRAHSVQKCRARRGVAAVMRQHEHVGAQLGAGRCERPLGVGLEIPHEQHAPLIHLDAQGERAIVARSAAVRARRPEGHHAQVPGRERRIPEAALAHRHARPSRGGAQRGEVRGGAPSRRQPDLAHRQRVEHRGQASAVVEICVARHQQIEAAHAERTQRGHHAAAPEVRASRQRGASIHQQAAAQPLHDQRVALSDIERHESRRGRQDGRRGRQREAPAHGQRTRDTHTRAASAHGKQRAEPPREQPRPRRSAADAAGRGPGRGPGDRLERDAREAFGAEQRERGEGKLGKRGARAGAQRRGQQREGGPGNRKKVREQRQRRRAAPMPDRQRRRRGDGQRGGADSVRPGRDRRRIAMRRPRQRGGGDEGKLGAGKEQRLGLQSEHEERSTGQRGQPGRRPRRAARQHQSDHQAPGAAHGHAPAGEQRVAERARERCRGCEATRVPARAQRGAARVQARCRPVEAARNQREVQPGDGE